MDLILNSLATLLVAFALCNVIGNYAAIVVSLSNRRRGVDRRVSMVLAVPQICLLLGEVISSGATHRFLPPWLFVVIGLTDPGLWFLAATPFVSIFRR